MAASSKTTSPTSGAAATRKKADKLHKLAKAMHQRAEATRAQTRAQKAKFEAAHAKGMAALKRGDYDAVGDAIAEEREAIAGLDGPRNKKKWQR